MSALSSTAEDFAQHASEAASVPAPPFSTQERFTQLLVQGMAALQAGSYGIAAAYVIRAEGVELALFGRNTLANNDPQGHAEMNAVRLAIGLLDLDDDRRTRALYELVESGQALIRPCGDQRPATELYSTLEPCPMCTVNILNAGIQTVTYAHEDLKAGALADERRRRLAPLWDQMAHAQGLQVRQCQSDRPADRDTFLPQPLRAALIELFEGSREELDRRLADRKFFSPEQLLPCAKAVQNLPSKE